MFGNNPFITKKDSLVEAVQKAQRDGDMRRQAVAQVNEQFGVYSRNAVVRENLAAYDAAVEEVYKGMMSGNLTEETQIDEISDALKARYLKKNVKDQEKNLKGYHKAAGKGDDAKADKYDRRIAKREHGYAMATKEETDYSAQDRAPVTKSAPKEDPSTPKSYPGAASSLTPNNPTSQRMSNAVKPKLQEAVSRKHFQQVADLIKGHESQEKRNELATHHAGIFAKQNPRFNHEKFHAAAGSTAHQQKKVDEAAYSAKAGRAGKDLGKPGKNFAKIAKKAGAKYGSEEKGKKVAGAILAKIRAKHMKEDSSF
jgi:hypothetical protein